ncbi:MAG: aspartate:alanine exchanger family transporter [Polyangiaceae bacterium]
MTSLISILRANAILLLFVVAGVGFVLGRIQIGGFGLGAAAVLFTGLAVSAFDESLRLPDFVYLFGLVVFVYTTGLSSGPGFFSALKRKGLRDNLLAIVLITVAAIAVGAVGAALGWTPGTSAGLFAGSITNTPALAAVVESLKLTLVDAAKEKGLTEPIVAYSVAYPGGVLGVLAPLYVYHRWSQRNVGPDAPPMSISSRPIETVTVKITRNKHTDIPVSELRKALGPHVTLGRFRHFGHDAVVTDETLLSEGDLVTVVGRGADLDRAIDELGVRTEERIDLDRNEIDFRRVFVSRAEITERPLSTLDLEHRFGARITRVRRGDADIVPDDNFLLELGDRARVVAPRNKLDEAAKFLGDSYRALGEVDVLAFSMGIALGLLVGEIPLGSSFFKLGAAGGPLVVGLVLGRLGRTGPVVWSLPYSASLTLRQLGLVLFLAGVGTRSGHAFASTLQQGGALILLGVSALVTLFVATSALVIGHRWLKVPPKQLMGMVSGIHTQPAALAFAIEQTKSDAPSAGYATVFPAATIAKVLVAQLLLRLFLRAATTLTPPTSGTIARRQSSRRCRRKTSA